MGVSAHIRCTPGFRKAAELLERSSRPVAVLAPLGPGGMCFVRALGSAGIPAIALTKDVREPTARTRRCTVVACPNGHSDELIELLVDLGQAARVKPALFPLGDVEALNISRHRDILRTHYDFALPPQAVFDLLLDKLRFSEWAAREGLPIARTWCARSEQDLEQIAGEVVFPCILKPGYRGERWNELGWPKGFRLADAQELRACYRQVSECRPEVVISEWVEGLDCNMYVGHFYIPRSGELVTSLTRKGRQYPPVIGTTSLAVAWRDEALLQLTADLCRRLEYHGPGAVEFKVDSRDGRPRIIETVVGRYGLGWYPALLQGLNLAHIGYCDIVGLPRPEYTLTDVPAKWVHEREDFASALWYLRQGKLTLAEYLRSLTGNTMFVHLDWRDPLPGLFLITETAGLVAQKLVGKLFHRGQVAGSQV